MKTTALKRRLAMTLLIAIMTTASAWAGNHFRQAAETKSNVSFAAGTEDVQHWSITPENPVFQDSLVTLTYTGTRIVKSVSVSRKDILFLSTLNKNVTVTDGMTLTGTLGANVKLSIADGATVVLKDVTINGVKSDDYNWAGITCEGDATLILKGTNYVKGFKQGYPGLFVPEGKTLTIRGNGSLEADQNGEAAGIGGGFDFNCGNIIIEGGTIVAYGKNGAAAIGGGIWSNCGNITITEDVASVHAHAMEDNVPSIGQGKYGICGTIIIGGYETGAIYENPYTYTGNGTSPDETSEEDPSLYQPIEVIHSDTDGTWTFTMPDNDVVVSVEYESAGYVTFAEGTEDVEHWSITPDNPVSYGSLVTLKYSGTRIVKSISAVMPSKGELSLATLNSDVTVTDGMTLTGTLDANVKVSIADGATVVLKDVTINGVNSDDCPWAGITCEGNATLILSGNNIVKGFHRNYPGLFVPEGKTLTICGNGSLEANQNGKAAGIGGGRDINCGNIIIEGGTIVAYGHDGAAAIGGGERSECGNITITYGVTSVYAHSLEGNAPSIGHGESGSCGTIIIGGYETGPIYENPYTFRGYGNSPDETPEESTGDTSGYFPIDIDPATWTFTMPTNHVIVSVEYEPAYDVTFAEDTEYLEYWSISPDNPVNYHSTVTLTYSGPRSVDHITAMKVWDGNLASLKDHVTVTDGVTLTGTLGENVKVSISDGATVTLQDVTIDGDDSSDCMWAGITCEGDATIILCGTNRVKGFYDDYPGIFIPEGKTLTIRGNGSLEANQNGDAAAIGGGWKISCGNIVIEGGTIVAYGGMYAAAIGGGYNASCGDITITDGVTKVTATKYDVSSPSSIGRGYNSTCGTVSIGGEETGPIAESPYTYTGNGSSSGETPAASSGDALVFLPLEQTPDKAGNTWTFTMPAYNVMVSVEYVPTYDVTFAEDTEDVEHWSITPENPIERGGFVILRYSGTKTVKSVTATLEKLIDLSTLNSDVTVPDGITLTGTLGANVKVSIADGATVALHDVTINGVNSDDYKWAGITCEGNATLILSGTNYVKGFQNSYPGIFVPEGKTLTIRGNGSLEAQSSSMGAGIGGGYYEKSCGNIVIEGGTIVAKGGNYAAGIGCSAGSNCGDITITDGVTRVTAYKGGLAPYSIGPGYTISSCGTITIGGEVTDPISESPYTYTGNGTSSGEMPADASIILPVKVTPNKGYNIWTFTMPASNVVLSGEYETHDVTFAEGTEDVEHWSITPENPIERGGFVILRYSGTKTVKSVTGIKQWYGDLSTLNSDVTVTDGMTLTGTLGAYVKVSIADGATVVLKDVTIDGINWLICPWAGITCEGDATLILKGTNYVQGFNGSYPGIFVPEGKTLTIRGNGSLEAQSSSMGAGIGGGYYEKSCGNIVIEGGTIVAKGGTYAAGIGCGSGSNCGDITITDGVTSVTAYKGWDAPYSIGPGIDDRTCGTITIGGQVTDPISESPYTYTGKGTSTSEMPPGTPTDPYIIFPFEVTPNEDDGTWTFTMPSSNVVLSVEYEIPTGLETVSPTPLHEQESWYTIDGRKLNREPSTKGVYIKDGRTVLVK